MAAFHENGVTYVDAQRVAEHLELLDDVGFVTYYQETSPIPDTLPRRLLSGYSAHLSMLRDELPEIAVYERDAPSGNYFMIYKFDDQSREAGKAELKRKSDEDADDWEVPRDWPTR
ncbi:hypothetical protein [Pseudomonas monteilii]|uniref:hypothetical protein n=1 Tax=Pseudomonas monteilii TaxID=76759 RepID=UPI00383ADFA3